MSGSHKPRKRFGQNFLCDPGVISQILQAINPKNHDHIVEIGPGQGALTYDLIAAAGKIDIIEIDRDLVALLQKKLASHTHLTIHECDALKFDFSKLMHADQKIRIVGNLPYNISTPLIFHLLKFAASVDDMHFMLQKEVVDRLAAQPGGKNYGRLSVMVQYACQVEALFPVSPQAFFPPPKVDSAIVRLRPYAEPPIKALDPDVFAKIVRCAFSQRRKTLKNNIKALIDPEKIASIGIDVSQRPEQIGLKDYVLISNMLYNYNS